MNNDNDQAQRISELMTLRDMLLMETKKLREALELCHNTLSMVDDDPEHVVMMHAKDLPDYYRSNVKLAHVALEVARKALNE